MATRSSGDNKPAAPVEQATAAPGEQRDAPRAGGVDGAQDQADAAAQAAVTPAPVGSGATPAESSDAAVHQILAERQTAEMNGDTDAVETFDKRLGAAGYDVK
jgi:hypothetical protein